MPSPVQGKHQGLVVGEHVELPSLQQEPEVAQGGHHSHQFPVQSAVPITSVSVSFCHDLKSD